MQTEPGPADGPASVPVPPTMKGPRAESAESPRADLAGRGGVGVGGVQESAGRGGGGATGADRGVRVERQDGKGTCEGGTCDTQGGDASGRLAERGSQHVREEGGEAGPGGVLAGDGET